MSHSQKLEQVLDLLLNEEHEAASNLLHSVMVEKARSAYEELVEEDFGGDEKEDFADEIEADKEEVEDAETGEDDFDSGDESESEEDEDEGEEEEEVEDRLEDVEDALAQLQAEFDRLMGDEEGLGDEEMGDEEMDSEGFGDEDFGGDFGDEEGSDFEEEDYEGLGEATKLQDEVPAVQNQEGRLAGTGKNSKTGATGKESMFTKAPRKADHGASAHEIGKGGDEKGMKAGQGKEHTPSDNLNVEPKKKDAGEMKGDGKFTGTGKGSKMGSVNTKSTLGSKGNPTGE